MASEYARAIDDETFYPDGLDELFSSGVLDSTQASAFEKIAWLAAKVLSAPIAFVSLLGGKKYWLYSLEHCDEQHLIHDLKPLQAETRSNDVFEIPDARLDPDYFDLPSFDGTTGIRFYASAPIAGPSGEVCGHFVLASKSPRTLSSEERNVLRCLADQIESELRLLLQMQEEASLRFAATKAFNAKSSFLSLISHEIRTPIAGIMGATDMLIAKVNNRAYEDNEAEKELLNTVWSSASDLLQLLNETLDAAKIEADGVQIHNQSFDLIAFCEKLKNHFKPLAENKGLDLNIRFDGLGEFSQHIEADPTRIRQILFNLIHNAMKFTGKGEVSCDISLLPREDNIENACLLNIEVSDTGIGMTQAEVANLFVPFNQANVGDDREYGGTGLGMTLVKQLVDRMEGTIAVRSQRGVGTQLKIQIPTFEIVEDGWVVDRRPELEDIKEGSLEAVDADALKGLQVLVVDDNSQNLFILSRVLETWGCDAIIAENGNNALQEAKSHSFDAIILDLHMPHKSGFEVARELRQYTSSTRLIACSADTTQDAYAKCQEAGFDDILAKPFDWALMHSALSKCV